MIIAFKLTLTHEGGKEIVLSLGIKTDQVHASVPAKVASVEPIPILKLVPGLPPRQEVIVSAPLHVRDSCRWRTKCWVFSSFIIRGKWLNSLYYLLFWHSSSTGLLSKGLPSGPILAGLWAKTADTVKANRLNCIRILRACSKDVKSFKNDKKNSTRSRAMMMMKRKTWPFIHSTAKESLLYSYFEQSYYYCVRENFPIYLFFAFH